MIQETSQMHERTDLYTFLRMKDLKAYYTGLIPDNILRSMIEKLKKDFKKRKGVPAKLNNLQFLKKCEWELNRILKDDKVE